jgi:hypothetical protein
MSAAASRIPATILTDTQTSMARAVRNKRGAIAANAIVLVQSETGRTLWTDSDFAAHMAIFEIMNVLATDEATQDSDRTIPPGSHPDEITGPVKPRLAAVQETLSPTMQAAE